MTNRWVTDTDAAMLADIIENSSLIMLVIPMPDGTTFRAGLGKDMQSLIVTALRELD